MSDIRANTISDAAGTGPIDLYKQSAAKAWVNFNGQGTIAARNSFNLSSLTDNGVGDYTVTVSSAFSAADFAVSLTSTGRDYNNLQINSEMTASTFRLDIDDSSNNAVDRAYVMGVAQGDLA